MLKFAMIGFMVFAFQNCDRYDELKPVVIAQCPELTQYSVSDLRRAATELRMLPTDSQIAEMMTDYGKLRDACRILVNRMRTYYYIYDGNEPPPYRYYYRG